MLLDALLELRAGRASGLSLGAGINNQILEFTMSNRREYARTAMNAAVMVRHPMIGDVIYKTRDISDGGVYVVVESGEFPPLGSIVEVQVQGLPVPAPILTMEVVRKGADGFGMQFV